MKNFSETLVQVMEERGIKAVELSAKSGVSQSYISKLAHNKFADPTFVKACQLIDALGMTPDEFLAKQRED